MAPMMRSTFPAVKRPTARRIVATLLVVVATAARAQSPTADEPSLPADTRAPAPPSDASRLDRVEVTGRRNETEDRRLSTAAKIVIGREEIEAFGDLSLSDVMKRLPSVTIGGRPGRGGQIRMRGMGNGYTQILIDGERIPRGFSIDQLSPDLVERIEIYRAPTAETGARAIAGTINIILREPLRQRGDDLRGGVTDERGRVQPNLAWTRNDVLGERGTYNLTISANRAIPKTDTATDTTFVSLATGQPDLVQRLRQTQHDERNALHASGRVQWDLGPGDQLNLQPFLSVTEGHSQVAGTLSQPIGIAPYASSATATTSRSSLARLVALFKKKLGDATRMELRGSVGSFRSTNDTVVDEYGNDLARVLDQRSATTIDDRSWTFTAKLFHNVGEQHAVVAGVETEGVHRDENSLTFVDGVPSVPGFGGDVDASTLRLAAYAQDDWNPSRAWAFNGGLRWETIRTRSDTIVGALGAPVHNDSTVLTPLGHAVWRFDEASRDQLRLAVTQSYRAPTLQNLIAIPSLSTLYPAPGPNVASSPDRTGNPDLRPERATGFDVALEHYLGTTGVISLSAFQRDIHDLIRTVTSLETVPWATTPRWVARPRNFGSAMTHGIEFDTKFQVDELVTGAPQLTVRSNVSVYGSHVSGVPGPYNRIDQQPRASANVGGDWRMKGLPLTVGANFNWIPPYSVQETDIQTQGYQLSRVVDAYVLWAIDRKTKLRLSLSNVVPRDYVTTNAIVAGGQAQTVVSDGPTYRVIGLRFEMKL